MLVASPQNVDIATNRIAETQKLLTSPNRRPIQPDNGCMIALASEYELIAQVPSWGLTARLPAMCGTDTLTIVMSSTSMNVANATATVSNASGAPCSGAGAFFGAAVSGFGSATADAQREADAEAGARFARTIASASVSAFAKSLA